MIDAIKLSFSINSFFIILFLSTDFANLLRFVLLYRFWDWWKLKRIFFFLINVFVLLRMSNMIFITFRTRRAHNHFVRRNKIIIRFVTILIRRPHDKILHKRLVWNESIKLRSKTFTWALVKRIALGASSLKKLPVYGILFLSFFHRGQTTV